MTDRITRRLGRTRRDGRSSSAGVLMCAAAMAMLGVSVPVSRELTDYPAATAQAARYGLAALVLGAVTMLASRRAPTPPPPTARQWALLVAMAATGLAGFNLALMLALRHAEPAAVAAVIGCVPLGLAVCGPLLRHRDPAPRIVLAALVVVAGTAVVHGSGHADVVGLAAAAAALAGDVAFSLMAARLSPVLGALRTATYGCALAVPLLAVVAVSAGEAANLRAPDAAETAAIAFLAVGLTALAFLLWFKGLSWAGVERAAVSVALVPLAATATTAFMDATLPSRGQVAGVVLVCLGLCAALAAGRGPRPPHPVMPRPDAPV
ncbi:DMT family transporter [Catellatospora citrea]|uniref:DMT family transporter n=1 Tax=Catellatospora citrea TaxID=53366 RepID=UPI0033E33292